MQQRVWQQLLGGKDRIHRAIDNRHHALQNQSIHNNTINTWTETKRRKIGVTAEDVKSHRRLTSSIDSVILEFPNKNRKKYKRLSTSAKREPPEHNKKR